jgi:hypothetical protein
MPVYQTFWTRRLAGGLARIIVLVDTTQAGKMALVFGTRNAYLIDTGRLDYKPWIGRDHHGRPLHASASCRGILSVVLRAKPITSIIAYASPLAFSQQLISERNPVPILRGATVRKPRYPSPAFTFDCPENPAEHK